MRDVIIETELDIYDESTGQDFVGFISIKRKELEHILNRYNLTIKEKK